MPRKYCCLLALFMLAVAPHGRAMRNEPPERPPTPAHTPHPPIAGEALPPLPVRIRVFHRPPEDPIRLVIYPTPALRTREDPRAQRQAAPPTHTTDHPTESPAPSPGWPHPCPMNKGTAKSRLCAKPPLPKRSP